MILEWWSVGAMECWHRRKRTEANEGNEVAWKPGMTNAAQGNTVLVPLPPPSDSTVAIPVLTM